MASSEGGWAGEVTMISSSVKSGANLLEPFIASNVVEYSG